jgi:lipoprotein Spr
MIRKLLFIYFYLTFVGSCSTKKTAITDADIRTGLKKNALKPNYTYRNLTDDDRQYFVKKLNVKVSQLDNEKLYAFIKEWEYKPYFYGGETKDGIDCSALMQELYKYVYGFLLPRTAQEMFFDNRLKAFRDTKLLKEGDLVFFRIDEEKTISHVGIYLHNGLFFNANKTGCVINNIKKGLWAKTYEGGARLKIFM